jgi:hypothetical protein
VSDLNTNSAGLNIGSESGATVQYSLNGSSGWTTTAPTPVEGPNTVFVRQIDAAGNTSLATSFSYTYDATVLAPSLSLLADTSGILSSGGSTFVTGTSSDLITSDPRVAVGAESGAIVEYSVNYIANNPAAATWLRTQPTDLSAGSQVLYVRQIDEAGNTSSVSSISFTLDTTVNTPSLSLASDTGSSNSDGITQVGVVNVASIESGASWFYRVAASDAALDTANWARGTGSSFTVLSESGEKYVQVKQIDVAGNESAVVAYRFTLDTSGPSTPTLSVVDSGVIDSSSAIVTKLGTVTLGGLEANAAWEYSTNGGIGWTQGSGNTFDVSGDGLKNILVRQIDVAGNYSQQTNPPFRFTLDTTAASPSISLATDSGSSGLDGITNVVTFDVTGAESGATIQYSVDGISWGAAPTYADDGSQDGAKTVYVRQIDASGNTSSASQALSFTLDTSDPTITFDDLDSEMVSSFSGDVVILQFVVLFIY